MKIPQYFREPRFLIYAAILFIALDIIALGLINPGHIFAPHPDYKFPVPPLGLAPQSIPINGPTPKPSVTTTTTRTSTTIHRNVSNTTTHPTTTTTTTQPGKNGHGGGNGNGNGGGGGGNGGGGGGNTTTVPLGPAGNITVTHNPLKVKVTTPLAQVSVP